MKKEKYVYKTELFYSDMKKLHDCKYTYDENIDVSSSTVMLKITCIHHGEFNQLSGVHKKGSGCPVCKKEKLSRKREPKISTIEWINQATKIHNGKFDYSKVDYTGVDNKVVVGCPIHGEVSMVAGNHLKGSGCYKCSSVKNGQYRKNTNDDILEKFISIHGDKYDYSKVDFKDMNSPVIIICPDHGEFEQTPSTHYHGKSGCAKCVYDERRITLDDWKSHCNYIHNGKYDYSETKLDPNSILNFIKYKCPDHGIIKQRATVHMNHGCPFCSNLRSTQETVLYEFLKTLFPDSVSGNRSVLSGKELDIYIPSKKLAIEFDGLYWHSSNSTECDYDMRKKHIYKTVECEKQGIQLIHIFENEYIKNRELIHSMLLSKLGIFERRVYARKTKIKEVSVNDARDFCNDNHIQGYVGSTYRFGLYFEDILISLVTVGKSRYSKCAYELLRFCNLKNTQVIGGASKLINHVMGVIDGDLVSYADRRYSTGKLYNSVGFTEMKNSEPNYWYIKGDKIWHRSNFQKHILKNKLSVFDENKTESENMYINGYRRIWDCGNKVFVYKNKKGSVN